MSVLAGLLTGGRRPRIAGGTPATVPVNTALPVISGTTTVGQTLSCSTGSWTESPSSYTYQWQRAGSPIGGATSSTYLLVEADETTLISCEVTATNAAGSSDPAAAVAVGPIEAAGEETPGTLGLVLWSPGGAILTSSWGTGDEAVNTPSDWGTGTGGTTSG